MPLAAIGDASLPDGKVVDKAWSGRCAAVMARALDAAVASPPVAGMTINVKEVVIAPKGVVQLHLDALRPGRHATLIDVTATLAPRVTPNATQTPWTRNLYDQAAPMPFRVHLERHSRLFDVAIVIASPYVNLDPLEARLRMAAEECIK